MIFLVLAVVALAGSGIWWLKRQKEGKFADRRSPPQIELVKLAPAERPLMGTLARIVVFAPDEESGRKAIEAAFERGEEIEAICTDYDPASELMKLSAAPPNQPVPVSSTLAAVLAYAHATAELTEGAFDPTFGPLTRLWRESRKEKALPDAEVLAKARRASSWKNFEVDLEKRFVVLKHEGMQLDLGGIAKGFAADEMLGVLNDHGIHHAFIAIAGDVRLGAPPPGKSAWRVGIKTLGPKLTQFIEVSNCAVSTSGDLYQFVQIDGVRYSHIIDPATGLGLTRRTAATVVAPTAVQTDPLATFCCIDPERALKFFLAGEISCRIVVLAEGQPLERATPQFPRVDAL